MKKCASCAKDLPEAAMHCVFCGAKQAPAPAVQPGMAKTSFGYSANDVMQQLGSQPPQQGGYQPPQQGGYQPPQQGYQPPQQDPRASQPQMYGGVAPPISSNAATVMAPPGSGPQFGVPQSNAPMAQPGGYGQPQAGYGQPQPGYGQPAGYGQPSAGSGGGMGIHSPPQPTPSPLPVAAPYLASQTAARAGRPIEPWKDSLKLMMIIWGAAALGAFATPMSIDPMGFNWDMIIDGPGKMKIPPLVWAAVALVSLAVGLLPMESLPRGIIAGALGIAGIVVPVFLLGAMPPWQILLQLVGLLVLIPGLFVRDEYVESMLARILVTVGVVCVLLPYLIPEGGSIPLVGIFKGLIEAEGTGKVDFILEILKIVLVVTALLAWMPGPATGGAKLIAWAIILFPVVDFAVSLLIGGGLGDIVSTSPGTLVRWVPGVAYTVLVGYGLATVIGKQQE